ncbi:uncharacterized protein LOC112569568 [Pomacea canaliculata]|uniref:uncharacterized protein LOC112569568 n=1 Tax=Pomacea canaliculata TaxID=400727 RepID=UPI000D72E431|nr:uncharacterized protein LOC112569568 [Pomacea canaliculata]
MGIFKNIRCFLLLLFLPTNKSQTNNCNIPNFDEIRQERENTCANVSYSFNIMDGSHYSGKFKVLFEVCEESQMALLCTFIWKKQSNELTTVNWSPENETTCFGKHRAISDSSFTFEIRIALLVKRAFSLLKISITDNEEKFTTLRLIRLEVMYPPKVTNLTIDGLEVNGSYTIQEGHEVTIACYFHQGNPPATFHMVVKTGQELRYTRDYGNITHLFFASCRDDWPVVVCKGEGSEYNQSVLILVKCPPQFVDNGTKTINPSERDTITFRVKAHTAVADMCVLTPMSSEDDIVKEVNCTLHGTPPDLVLSLHLGEKATSMEGKWILLLRNEKGSAKKTLSILKAYSKWILTGWRKYHVGALFNFIYFKAS